MHVCHMCKSHVIPYLFVYSVPSWGPHAGCRQIQLMATLVLYVLTVGQFVCRPFVEKSKRIHAPLAVALYL